MPKTSNAMLKAIKKYQTEKTDEIKVRVPKGEKEIIQKRAEFLGKKVNAYIVDLIYADLKNNTSSKADDAIEKVVRKKAIKELLSE